MGTLGNDYNGIFRTGGIGGYPVSDSGNPPQRIPPAAQSPPPGNREEKVLVATTGKAPGINWEAAFPSPGCAVLEGSNEANADWMAEAREDLTLIARNLIAQRKRIEKLELELSQLKTPWWARLFGV